MESENTNIQPPHTKQRNPWIAVLLSLLMPGMGHIYCGSIIHGFVIIFIVLYFMCVWLIAPLMNKPMPIMVAVASGLIAVITSLIAIVDSYRLARRTRPDYRLKDYNNIVLYIMVFLICLGGPVDFIYILQDKIIKPFKVPSHSMTPTIQSGDRVIANKLAYKNADPERGNIVLFDNPENRNINFIKRVVAIAGDTVEIKNSELYINSQKLPRDYIEDFQITENSQTIKGKVYLEHNGNTQYKIMITENTDQALNDFGPVTVPDYSCFVMGDNRNMSLDSRTFGPLQTAALRGKFQCIYYAHDGIARIGGLYKNNTHN